MTERSVFLAALDVADAADRAVYLDSACAADADLRRRVEALLAAHAASDTFMAHPAVENDPRDTTGEFAHAEPVPFESGLLLAERYRLLGPIGEGGMGTVYRAEQVQPVKRMVAVKLIKPGMDTRTVLARFEAERQALALMDHPHIAKVFDAGATPDGRPFFVMELVEGVPITQFCDERKLTPRQRLELFVQVCQAIQHAHQKGVIHRDIKPSNVLVALYDDRPVPKVIDFGIAKAAGSTLTDKTLMTGFGAVVGTPEYMSPEQASLNKLDIDTRSDVYSLGVLLYELLTGTTPVDKKSLGQAALLEVLRIVREVEAPKPSAKLSSSDTLPSVAANRGTEPAKLSKLMKGELDWMLLKALEKDRTRRYDTATALGKDVQRYLNGDAVEACPPTLGYRLRTAYRRNRAAVWVATAFALLLCAAVTFSSWLAVKATRAEAAAVAESDRTHEAFEIEQRARRRFRAVYRTSSVDLFLTAYMADRDGVELITFRNSSWKTIHMIRTLTDDYLTESGKAPAAKAIRAEGLMWQGVDQYGEMSYLEALDSFRQAEAIYLELVSGPNSGDTRADLTNCRMLAAFAALSAKRNSEASTLAVQAEIDAHSLSDDFPDNPEYQYELALILWQVPTFRRMGGDHTLGVSHLQDSSRVLEQLVRAYPEVLHYRTGLANVLLAIASERKHAKESAEAIRLFGEAAAVLDAVHAPAREPIPMLRKWAFRGRARLLTDAGRHAEAALDWKRAVDEAPEPLLNPYDRSEWALALARSGEFASARTQADQVSKSSTFSAAYRNAAHVFSMSVLGPKTTPAEREMWAAKAVALLRRCQDFYDDPRNYSDPVLDPIRERPDFRELLEEVRRKAKPEKAK